MSTIKNAQSKPNQRHGRSCSVPAHSLQRITAKVDPEAGGAAPGREGNSGGCLAGGPVAGGD